MLLNNKSGKSVTLLQCVLLHNSITFVSIKILYIVEHL